MFRAEDAHHVSLSTVLSLFSFVIYQLCRLLELLVRISQRFVSNSVLRD